MSSASATSSKVRSAKGAVACASLTAQLIDVEDGSHLWADRFDGSLEDVFDLQEEVATRVAGVIEPALRAAETRRSAARPMADLGAYDLYLRALAVFYPVTKERVFEALSLFERATIDRSALWVGSWIREMPDDPWLIGRRGRRKVDTRRGGPW